MRLFFLLAQFSLLVLLNPFPALSQVNFMAGPIIGVGTSGTAGGPGPEVSLKPHIHAGLLTSFNLNKKLKIQPAVVISTKGYADSQAFPHDNMSLRYVDFILPVKYFYTDNFFFGGGFQAGILTYSYYKHLAYGTDYYDESDLDGLVNTFDYGLTGNFGWQFKSGVGIEISLIYGLRNIFNSNADEPLEEGGYTDPAYIQDEFKGQNTVLSGSFYYLIGKKQTSNSNK